jgi:DNA-binding MarR family transcriptional regulator
MSEKSSKFCGCLYYSSNALARIVTKIAEEEFVVTGMSPSYAFVLMAVNDNPGIKPMEISEIMMLQPSTITRFIDKLEYNGFLNREIKGKYTEVYPTEKSSHINEKLHLAWQNLNKRYNSVLGENQNNLLTITIYDMAKKLALK